MIFLKSDVYFPKDMDILNTECAFLLFFSISMYYISKTPQILPKRSPRFWTGLKGDCRLSSRKDRACVLGC